MIPMHGRYLNLTHYYLVAGYYFSRFAARRFYRQRGFQIAAALAYTTLLSVVPFATVTFGVIGRLPYFSGLQDTVQGFITRNFMPAFGDAVWTHLNVFSDRAAALTLPGIAVLVLIALLLMATIENAFNIIWHIRNHRPAVARFVVYWTILTLGPLLAGTGVLAASYLFSLELFNQLGGVYGLRERFISWLPFITTVFVFALIYHVIPNCPVRRRHAFTGALLAALLFEGAKAGFRVYLQSVPTYQVIYGAIAVVPVFLIWVYISWVIVILGAHFTFCLSAFNMKAECRLSRRVLIKP
jgi:membrane protein